MPGPDVTVETRIEALEQRVCQLEVTVERMTRGQDQRVATIERGYAEPLEREIGMRFGGDG